MAETQKPEGSNAPTTGESKRKAARKYRIHKRKQKMHTPHAFGETTKRIGLHSAQDSAPIGSPDTKDPAFRQKLFKPGFFTLSFGVVLPLLALAMETSTHSMAKYYFDPFPTYYHVFLFLLIPISNFLSWLSVRVNITPLHSMMCLASGMSLGIAILYSVMLLPLTPMFALNLLAGGFLGLAPLLSIPVTLMCGKTICQLADFNKTFFDAHQLKHLGHLIILVMVVAVELPSTLTRAQLAQTDDPRTQKQAVQWLRQWGDREVLLRACYERAGKPTDILGTMAEQHHPIGVDKARQVYYQVTGVAFNSVPIPASFRGTIEHSGLISDPAGLNGDVKDEFDLDPDIAGELVSGVARGLSVSNSSLEGTMDSANGIGILDWDFTFENTSSIPREARAKILLPPNAVVTKATLWLDDWMKETTIQERSQARNTYVSSVMNHKRDPLLVSMAGKDSVLVQCYPVVKGTKTRIRLHIVSPLVLSSKDKESLLLPTFEERNFAITIPHKLALDGSTQVWLDGVNARSTNENGKWKLTANVENSLLSRFNATPTVLTSGGNDSATLSIRPPESNTQAREMFYSQLPNDVWNNVRAISLAEPQTRERPLTIVIDKSVSMAPYMKDVIDSLKSAPKNLSLTIIEVKDGFEAHCTNMQSSDPAFAGVLKKLEESKCEGGQCDSSALGYVVAKREQFAKDLLWIHAAQPVSDPAWSNMFKQAISRKDYGINALYDLQVASGPNEILGESFNYPTLERVVRTGALSADLSTFLQNLGENKIRRSATTFGVKNGSTLPEVAQVQAYKLALARYLQGDHQGALELANRYHLVTPVSSAVVIDEDAPMPEPVKNKEVQKQEVLLDNLKKLSSLGSFNVGADYDRKRTDLEAKMQAPTPGQRHGSTALYGTQIYEADAGGRFNTDKLAESSAGGFAMPAEKSRMHRDEVSDSRQMDDEGAKFSSMAPAAAPPPPVPTSSFEQGASTDMNSFAGAMKGDMPAAPVLQGATNGTVGPQAEETWSKDSSFSAGNAGCETIQISEGQPSRLSAHTAQIRTANTFFSYLAFAIVLLAAFVMFVVFKIAALVGRDSLNTKPD